MPSPLVHRWRRAAPVFAAAVIIAGVIVVPITGAAAAGSVISTYAGGLGAGSATNVGQTPAGVVARDGVTYVADTAFNVVRKITETGQQSVFAGTGEVGYSGDGGPATAATLRLALVNRLGADPPPGLTLVVTGNLYIADVFNHVIRKVDVNGVITTAAGTGVAGFTPDGSQASQSKFDRPSGLAFDVAGNLDIADTGNHRVRQLVTAFVAVTTIAGTGTPGLAVDGTSATAAQLNAPTGVDVDVNGNVYIATRATAASSA